MTGGGAKMWGYGMGRGEVCCGGGGGWGDGQTVHTSRCCSSDAVSHSGHSGVFLSVQFERLINFPSRSEPSPLPPTSSHTPYTPPHTPPHTSQFTENTRTHVVTVHLVRLSR